MTLRPIGTSRSFPPLPKMRTRFSASSRSVSAEAAELGDPEPGAVGQLQQRAVPPRERLFERGCSEQRLDLLHAQRVRKHPCPGAGSPAGRWDRR